MDQTKRGRELNPYNSDFLVLLDSICLLGLKSFRLPLDSFLSSFGPTTTERKHFTRFILKRMLLIPLLITFILVTLPLAIVAGAIWLTFQHKKTPYRISVNRDCEDNHKGESVNGGFTFATTNLCLLQQCLSRFNNQTDPFGRSKRQGIRIAQQQLHVRSLLQKNINSDNHFEKHMEGTMQKNGYTKETSHENGAVFEEFPPIDILLIQVGIRILKFHTRL